MKKIFIISVLVLIYSCKTKIQYVEQERTYILSKEETALVKKEINSKKTAFYFIRHAESNGNRATNPHLIEKGIKRAKLYAKYFVDKKIDTIFTTNLNRTIETANIIAKSKGVPIIFYDPFTMDYNKFLEQHKNSSSIIVGHSNTTPNFVNGIIGKPKYSQMVEENYSDMFIVAIDSDNSIHDGVFVLEDEIQKMEDAKLSPKELKKVLKARRKAAKKKL